MAVYTVIPKNAHLMFDDVRDTLNANGGAVSDADSTTLISAAANINPDAKYKPTVFSKDFPVEADNQWKADDGNCGWVSPDWRQSSSGGIWSIIDGNLNGWAYQYPDVAKGHTHRIADFEGYDTTARMLSASNIPVEIFFDTDGTVTTSIQVKEKVEAAVGAALGLQDIECLKYRYLGILFEKITDGLERYFVSATDSIAYMDDPLRFVIVQQPLPIGEYRALIVVSESPSYSNVGVNGIVGGLEKVASNSGKLFLSTPRVAVQNTVVTQNLTTWEGLSFVCERDSSGNYTGRVIASIRVVPEHDFIYNAIFLMPEAPRVVPYIGINVSAYPFAEEARTSDLNGGQSYNYNVVFDVEHDNSGQGYEDFVYFMSNCRVWGIFDGGKYFKIFSNLTEEQ